jgi:hypothetical protein
VAEWVPKIYADDAKADFPWSSEPHQSDSEFQDPFKAYEDAFQVYQWFKKYFGIKH